MTKKKVKGNDGGGGNHNTNDASDRKRHEQPLQAVVLAADWPSPSVSKSSFSSAAFQPLILDRPKVLCPIVNQTMIDYTIHYLCNQGVQELYIVCASYDVEVYVNGIITYQQQQSSTSNTTTNTQDQQFASSSSSSSSALSSTMKIIVVRDMTITNDGDALREMEKRNVIQSDPFILMYGDTITNVSLPEKIKLYQQYRTSIDTSTISMMLFKSIGTSSPLHSTVANNVMIGFNNNNTTNYTNNSKETSSSSDDTTNECKRILLYDNHSHKNSYNQNYIQFPCSFMNQICNDVMIRTDLYDTGIDICSPELLVRFSDEFDYQNIRNEFVTNTVAEEEIGLQQSIYGCIVSNTEYAARIHDVRIYHQISKDLLRRYVYPTVPDNVAVTSFHSKQQQSSSSLPELFRYSVQNHFLYQQYEALTSTNNTSTYNLSHNNSGSSGNGMKTKSTRIGRTSIVTGPGLIGHSCHIDEHCYIRSSVIGHSCSISNHCTISNSHIWDNTIIEANVTIHHSIIASHVLVKSGVTIPRGCIIGSGCIIGKDTKLSEYTRLTCTKPDDENDFNMDDDNDDWDGDDKMPDEGVIQNKGSADDDDEDDDFVSDLDVVGTDGKGRVWQPSMADNDDDDDDDDEPVKDDAEQITTMNNIAIQSQCIGFDIGQLSAYRLQQQDYDDDDDSFSDEDEYDDHNMGRRPYDNENDDFDDDDDDDDGHVTFGEPTLTAQMASTNNAIIGRQDGVDVVKELKLICLEYEGGSIDNLGIELNSYKFSQNATYADCTMAAMMAIIEKLHITSKMSDGKLISEFKSSMEQWSSLLHKMCIGMEEELAIVLGLERCAIGHDTTTTAEDDDVAMNSEQVTKLSSGMSFRLLLQTLHDEEIVSEEAILQWASERRNDTVDGDALQKRRRQLFQLPPVQDFLEWLEDGDDDDDDDEEENDEEDDDE